MRLVYVCNDFGIPIAGTKGASIHVRAILRGLADIGHDVHLLSPKEGPDAEHPAKRILPAGCRPADQCGRILKPWLVDHGFGDSIARELRPLLYNAWVREKAAAAVRELTPDAIVERLALHSFAGADLADAVDVPLIVEVNALLTEEAQAFRSLELRDLAKTIERKALQRADAILAVSHPLADRLGALGIDPEKIHVVPNGADIAKFQAAPARAHARQEIGIGNEFLVGFVGSLKHWHGVEVLLKAFAKIVRDDPFAKLLIVGKGPAEQSLRQLATEMRLESSVLFLGPVSHERVPALIRAMDVAVAPFRPVDNFYFSPIKIFEYMAAGTCVVASRLGQIQDIVEDGVTGMLCRPDDVNDLYAALDKARQSEPLRAELGTRALHHVRQNFTWAHTAEKAAKIISATIARHAMRRHDKSQDKQQETRMIEAAS